MKTFLEIGCADFDTLLPLARKGGWCGFCVEPMPHHADTLRERSADLPVSIIEAAISDFDGRIQMAVGGNADWATGASHVISPNHQGFKLLDLEANKDLRLGEIEVAAMRLDTLLDEYGINHIDYCKIDVEGHELNVLQNYSWRVKPAVLKIEHKHLPGGSLAKILTPQGYTIFPENEDIYAIL